MLGYASVEDTSPEAKTRCYDLLRALTPERRLQIALGLTRAMRELANAGIREQVPHATAAELQVRLRVRLHGRATAERLFGSVPADAR